MARQTHPVFVPVGPIGDYTVANVADLTFTPSDPVNFEQVRLTGKEMLIVRNVGATPRNYTITSVPNALNRTGDINQGLNFPAGEWRLLGPFGVDGWRQSDGNLYFQGDNVEVEWAVIRIP